MSSDRERYIRRTIGKWVRRVGMKLTLRKRIVWHLDEHIIEYGGMSSLVMLALSIIIILLLG